MRSASADEQQRQRERQPRPVDDPAEHVAAELVGAEQVLPATGALQRREVLASGSYGASSGAKMAITIQAPAIVMPTIASGLAPGRAARRRPARGAVARRDSVAPATLT